MKFDTFVNSFSTSHSLYGLVNPYVKYTVVRDNDINILLRMESNLDEIDLLSVHSIYYTEKLLENIDYFKVNTSNPEYIEFYVKAKGMKDIYFKFNRVVDK